VFLSTRLVNIPHHVELHYQAVVHRRLKRHVLHFCFSSLEAHARVRSFQRNGIEKLICRKKRVSRQRAFTSFRTHITCRARKRQRAVALYVKQAFSILAASLNAWVLSKQRRDVQRRRMLGLRWAIANSTLSFIMGEWAVIGARTSCLKRLECRVHASSLRKLLRKASGLFFSALVNQRTHQRNYGTISHSRALKMMECVMEGWAKKARMPQTLKKLHDRCNGRFLSRLSNHSQPFVMWCVGNYLRQWHACVIQRTTNALLEDGCATRIQNQRMRCLIQKWLCVASGEIDLTLKHVRIEEKAAQRISRHYMQQCTNEMRQNAAARAYRRRIYQAQTRAACRALFIAGMLAFRSFVENR